MQNIKINAPDVSDKFLSVLSKASGRRRLSKKKVIKCVGPFIVRLRDDTHTCTAVACPHHMLLSCTLKVRSSNS